MDELMKQVYQALGFEPKCYYRPGPRDNPGSCVCGSPAECEPKCERCGGTGLVTLKGVPNGIGYEMDADEQPCPECKE